MRILIDLGNKTKKYESTVIFLPFREPFSNLRDFPFEYVARAFWMFQISPIPEPSFSKKLNHSDSSFGGSNLDFHLRDESALILYFPFGRLGKARLIRI